MIGVIDWHDMQAAQFHTNCMHENILDMGINIHNK